MIYEVVGVGIGREFFGRLCVHGDFLWHSKNGFVSFFLLKRMSEPRRPPEGALGDSNLPILMRLQRNGFVSFFLSNLQGDRRVFLPSSGGLWTSAAHLLMYLKRRCERRDAPMAQIVAWQSRGFVR